MGPQASPITPSIDLITPACDYRAAQAQGLTMPIYNLWLQATITSTILACNLQLQTHFIGLDYNYKSSHLAVHYNPKLSKRTECFTLQN